MSENALSTSPSQSWSSRSPGVSTRIAPSAQHEQLAVPRHVPAAAVAPQVARPHQLAPGERVDERRLAGSGRAQQRERLRRYQVLTNSVEPLSGDVAHRQHGDADGYGLGFCDLLVVLADVELRQHDHGRRARVPGGDEIALETAGVEVSVETGDEEHRVDVRDERVLFGLEPRRLARDLRAPRQDGLDGRAAARCVAHGHPVADGRHAARDLVVAELAAGTREPVVALAADVVAAAMLRDDAGGLEAPLGIDCHRRLELVGPAERGKGIRGHACSLCRRWWPRNSMS